jgi:uncharacterized membrane protein
MPSFKSNYGQSSWIERIVAALCYFSCGLVGLIYILITGQNRQTAFFQFNFLQGILLGIFAVVLNMAFNALGGIFGGTVGMISQSAASAVVSPINVIGDLVSIIIKIALLYGAVWALLGKQPEIPLVSRLVRQQMR